MTLAAARAPRLLLAVLVVLAVAAAYLPTLGNGFTNWDDETYVTGNPGIRSLSPRALGRHFTSFWMGNYHPLTMVSHALDWSLFGPRAGGHHAMSLLLHLLVTLLVWRVALLLGASTAAAAAASLLFGLHPMHVESVAWASERKDVLAALFFFASLAAWLRHRSGGSRGWYGASLALFVAALLSKSMAVTLPLVLVLAERLAGRKVGRRTLLPFFALSLAFGLTAFLAQRSAGAVRPLEGLGLRNLLAPFHGLLFYLGKLLVPVRLSAFYPYPPGDGLPWSWLAAPLAAAALAALLVPAARRSPRLAFGLLFFLLTILPVLQIVPVGHAAAADRYTYIPSFGLFFAAGTGLQRLLDTARPRRLALLALLAAVLLAASSLWLLTRQRTLVWRDSLSLWSDAIEKFPARSPVPYGNRALALEQRGEARAALDDWDRAIALKDTSAQARRHRGRARLKTGDAAGAMEDFERALELEPRSAEALEGRGISAAALGKWDRAVEDLSAALEARPEDAGLLYGRGLALLAAGDRQAAARDIEKALLGDPGLAGAPAPWLPAPVTGGVRRGTAD